MGDLLSGYMAMASQIDTLWNIFMGLHLALFAGLWKVTRPLLAIEAIIVLLAYFMFAYLNWNALRADYEILLHIQADLIEITRGTTQYSNTHRVFTKQIPSRRSFIVLLVHILAALVMTYYVLQVPGNREKLKDKDRLSIEHRIRRHLGWGSM